MKRVGLLLLLAGCLFGQRRDVPRHLFHPDRTLTEASSLPPREIAASYLRSLAPALGLNAEDVAALEIIKEYRTPHNGVTHLVYRQRVQGVDVYNAEWVINIDSNGRVINAGGDLFRSTDVKAAPPDLRTAHTAVRAAIRAVNPELGERFYPLELDVRDRGRNARFHRGGLGEDVFGRAVWYAVDGRLEPAWVFQVVDADTIHSYEVVVNSEAGAVYVNEPRTYFQNAPPARGLVFDNAPQSNPTPGIPLTALPAYRQRTLQSFTGDPTASPRGWVTGTETVGNNVIAGENREAVLFLTSPRTASVPDRNFSFPLQLGPDAPTPVQFADAATTNLFYWTNRAHDLHYAAGFDEQAGNYQQDNFGRGGVGSDPIYAYSHFGVTDVVFPDVDNAFYTTRAVQDGSQSMIAMFLATFGGTVFTDGSLDAQVIIHEYTHGVSTRLVRQLSGAQGGAMGEAWSDFYALEYTLPEGTPLDGSYPTGEYFSQANAGIRTRPYSTDMNVNPLTYAQLGRVITRPENHADGEIWVEALWEARAALIRQFGEREGRRRIRLLVMDGMKLATPAPSMVDARDAILLADRTDFQGASQTQLWGAFARRGLGVLAQSTSANTVHIAPSFDVPSSTAKIGFYEPVTIQGEPVRIVLHDANQEASSVLVQVTTSSGDLENLNLTRRGMVYTGALATTNTVATTKQDGFLSLIPGDSISVYHVDAAAENSAKLVEATVETKGTYSLALGPTTSSFTFPNETALGFRAAPRTFRRYDLPFDFSFFGRIYRSLRIYNNGLLVFDMAPAPTCIDAAGLSQYAAIAPLWMELQTAGGAQENEDVYVSRNGTDSITFRWAAETAPPLGSGVVPVPVNFAATLFNDGRITFQYGSKNEDLAAPSATTACGDTFPVVGIASGSGAAYPVGGYFRATNLQNARPLQWAPPYNFSSIPQGQLDTKEGDSFQGILSGTGVAYDTQASVQAIYVLVDGVNVGRAQLGQQRPDFCATNRVPGCPAVGFTYNFDAAALQLSPGAHKLQTRIVNTRYAFADIPQTPLTIQITSTQGRQPKGAIELPTDGTELSGTTRIRGYAYIEGLRITNLDLLIDGVTYGNPILIQRRDDICSGLSNVPNCPFVGFDYALNTVTGLLLLPNGQHSMQIRVLDETGRFSLLPDQAVVFTVNNIAAQPPVGVLESPANNDRLSGMIRVSGYAYDPGTTIAQVTLLIDGETRAVAQYGSPRPTECATLPNAAACPNIGFDLNFDTRVLSDGPHVLAVRVANRNGKVSTIPGPVGGLTYGINVIVQNNSPNASSYRWFDTSTFARQP